MKKRLFALFFALLLLCAAPVCAAPTLTPGLACLAEDAALVKSGVRGELLPFTQGDFKQALGVPRFDGITVTTLPDPKTGTLLFSGKAVKEGQRISFSSLYLLKFMPSSPTVTESNFTFTAGDLAGGAEIPCRIRFTDRTNYAPTVLTAAAESLALKTRLGIACFGSLSASDPEGDRLFYRITRLPAHGTVVLRDAEKGSYQYTPKAGYTGKDSFSYAVRDEYGNWSEEAQVTVQVAEAAAAYVYADMANHPAALAAMELTARNMMCGTLSGDEMLFEPDGTVTRGDFVVMAMKAVGVSPIGGLENTCFDDNEQIPATVRPYVATAQRYGIVHGSFEEEGLCFRSESAVTRAEAAVILCRLLDAEVDSYPTFADGDAIPVWARGAIAALYELGIYSAEDGTANAASLITRADAADMLYRTVEYCE